MRRLLCTCGLAGALLLTTACGPGAQVSSTASPAAASAVPSSSAVPSASAVPSTGASPSAPTSTPTSQPATARTPSTPTTDAQPPTSEPDAEPAQCSATTEPASYEQAARCLHTAWLSQDRAAANGYASPVAVEQIFAWGPAGPADDQWAFEGCGLPSETRPSSGVACHFHVPGEVHGVAVEMAMAQDRSVESITSIG